MGESQVQSPTQDKDPSGSSFRHFQAFACALAGSLVSLCRDHQCGQHLRCPQECADHAGSRQLCRIFVFLAEVVGILQICHPSPRRSYRFHNICFPLFWICLSFVWIQVVTVAVEALCF